MAERGGLGSYLRARRALVQPEDVGLARGDDHRRVAGLRREEVAILAGVSTDYYLRLEQGRDVNPSTQVLDALARVLGLDPVATAYLHRLARSTEPRSIDDQDAARDATVWLIDSWPRTAAMVHNRYMDVLASNRLARALNPNYTAGTNSLLALLSDPAEQAFHQRWEPLAARSIALLRSASDGDAEDPRLDDHLARLAASSDRFQELWDRNDVVLIGDGIHQLHHPVVGDLDARYARLPLVGTAGHSLFIYYAEPGSPTAMAFDLLASAEGD